MRRTPTLSPTNVVVDGPSADIQSLNGLSIARDGAGGLVYIKDVGGVAHVFVSRLLDGSFQPPEQVDAGLSAASSQPVIAAGQGGLLLVSFVNQGNVYVVAGDEHPVADRRPGPAVRRRAQPVAVAVAVRQGLSRLHGRRRQQRSGAHRLLLLGAMVDGVRPAQRRSERECRDGWRTARASICAGDGVGIVAWGEGGHVYTRRVVGTSPSARRPAGRPDARSTAGR